MHSTTSKRTRIITVLLSAMMLFAMIPAYSANAATSADLNKVKTQKKSVATKLLDAEAKLTEQQKKMDSLQSQIDEKSADVKATKKELADTEKKLEKRKTDLEARVRAMYKSGSAGYLDIILNSASVSDFFSNIEMVKKIYVADQKALNEIQKQEAILKEKQEKLETEQKELEDQKKELADQKKEFDKELASLQSEYKKLDAEEAKIDAEVNKQISTGTVTTSSGQTVKVPTSSGSTSTGVSSSMALSWPTSGSITCEFGTVNSWHTSSRGHSGIDIANSYGTPIRACADGTVTQAGYNGSYGNYIVINHGNGLTTLYAHNSSLMVSVGQRVSRGQQIARMGSTGYSSGNHCHLSVYLNGVLVNPRRYLA